MIYLDTHVVAWLYAGDVERLSAKAHALLEQEEPRISPIVLLELQYLHEIGRLTVEAGLIQQTLTKELGLTVCTLAFERVIWESLRQSWTRDPFDRVIVAQAELAQARLLTKDRVIRRHYAQALW